MTSTNTVNTHQFPIGTPVMAFRPDYGQVWGTVVAHENNGTWTKLKRDDRPAKREYFTVNTEDLTFSDHQQRYPIQDPEILIRAHRTIRELEIPNFDKDFSLDQIFGMAQAYLEVNKLRRKAICSNCGSSHVFFKLNEVIWDEELGKFVLTDHIDVDNAYCNSCEARETDIDWRIQQKQCIHE